MPEPTNTELLDELGADYQPKENNELPATEEAILACLDDLKRFMAQHRRKPSTSGEDVFERILATRLKAVAQNQEYQTIIQQADTKGLLAFFENSDKDLDEMDNAALLEELDIDVNADDDLTRLVHVKPHQPTEEIGERIPCENFDDFKAIFTQVQNDLKNKTREALPYTSNDVSINKGDLFILHGQKTYIAEMGEIFVNNSGNKDSRLRVIYDNATESNILMRTLQRDLGVDKTARRISSSDAGPLFSDEAEEGDKSSGTIYICQSLSNNPEIAANRHRIHKIGGTSNQPEKRIADAENDPTFLLAKAKIVASYELVGINRVKLENLLHRFFDDARLDITIKDRFGKPVDPREWFLVTLECIEQAVEHIKQGTITEYYYDTETASVRKKTGITG